MEATKFAPLLALSEIGVGTAHISPIVPATVASARIDCLSASLVGMYLKTPSMTLDHGIRPSQEGTAAAKDVWLVGAGLTMLTQGVTSAANSGANTLKRALRKDSPLAR